MRRRWRHMWLGMGVVMALLAAVPAPAAVGATESWEFEASTYDFGPVPLGSHPVHQFILTNTGEAPIASGSWRLRWVGPPLDPELLRVVSSNCSWRTLEPQESCSISVSFNPIYLGPKEGEVGLISNSPGVASAAVELEGEGVGPLVVIEPEHLIFGAVQAEGGTSPPQTAVVKNHGNYDLAISGISFTDLAGAPQSPSPFRVVGGSCQPGQVVVPGGSCTIEVALAPSQSGSFRSRLAISDNAYGPPQSIELQGTGTPPVAPPRPSHQRPSVVRVTQHPASVTWKSTARFRFFTRPSDASAECALDHLGFKPCSSPSRYTKLAKGRHSFRVRVSGASSSSVLASASFHWLIRPRR